MSIHVFVVDSTTFKLHLEYLFAGTGAKDKTSPFLNDPKTSFHHSTERNLVGMIADISRVRPGDKILFYLQATSSHQGMFFGIFKASSIGFFDENDDGNFLKNELGKGLSFRVRIIPDCVYAYGITEHEYLDDLSGKEAPWQLCWSMIYRKLKGNRGCTMITQQEYDDLKQKLVEKNNGSTLKNSRFSFDQEEIKIINIEEDYLYTGRQNSLDIKQRLLYKAHKGNAFETHLQALVMQNYDNEMLSNYLLMLNTNSIWVGNEVSCGVGMQRIDSIIIQENEEEIHIKIIELKDEEPHGSILDYQLPWYLKWVSQYIVPNLLKSGKSIILHPCILAKNYRNREFINRIRDTELIELNNPHTSISTTEFIGFSISDSDIVFEKIV